MPKQATRKVPQDFKILDASAAGPLEFIEPTEEEIQAAGGEKPKLRKFKINAYNGGPMSLAGFYWPVVVDLAGLSITDKSRPILRDHDPGRIVGHSETITNNGKRLTVTGAASAANEHSREVEASADNGFPWQASIGASGEKMVFLDKGEKQTVNGKEVTGPVYIARKAKLKEVSFVALGADDSTRVKMVAAASCGMESEIRAEIGRLTKAGKTYAAIAAAVDRNPDTIEAIATGTISNAPRTLLEKLKRI